jgi:serine protease Do
VIGIVSNILSRSGGFEGIGFAATSKMARILLEQKPFWSDMEGILIQGDLAGMLNLQQPAGFWYSGSPKGLPVGAWESGPAHYAPQSMGAICCWAATSSSRSMGLRFSKGTRSFQRIYESISNLKPGEQMVARVLRAGHVVELSTEITQ